MHPARTEADGRLADRGRHGAERGSRDDDDRRQGHESEHHAADKRRGARQAHKAQKDRKAQQPEDDGGNGREVVDIDLDEVRPPVARREFLQIDRRHHPERKAQHEAGHEREERAGERPQYAGKLGFPAVAVREEAPVERAADTAFRLQPVEPGELLFGEAPGVTGGRALEQHVHFVVGRHPDAHRPADRGRILEDKLAQLEGRPDAHQLHQPAPVPALAHCFRKDVAERRADDGPVVRGRKGFGVAPAGGIENDLFEGHIERDLGLGKRADALGPDRADQQDQEAERNADGSDAVKAEARFRPPPSRQRRQDRHGRALPRVSHSVPGSGARA